jgi:hypothetical protein
MAWGIITCIGKRTDISWLCLARLKGCSVAACVLLILCTL